MVKSQEENQTTPINLPTHLGFIVDGNRRWAKARGLPTLEGHRRGAKQLEKVAEVAINKGIKYLSFYVFSTENWGRTQAEVDYLMDLLLSEITRLIKKMKKLDVRCVILGSPDCPRPDIWQRLLEAEKDTQDCSKATICFCFNYGGQQEIADAASALVAERLAARAEDDTDDDNYDSENLAQVTVEDLDAHIYHPEVPPVDMIIRTSGEERISGFMLWRAAYSEFMFINKTFPDVDESVVDDILAEYGHRHRRFGK